MIHCTDIEQGELNRDTLFHHYESLYLFLRHLLKMIKGLSMIKINSHFLSFSRILEMAKMEQVIVNNCLVVDKGNRT